MFADISSLPQDALLSPMCCLIVGPRRSCVIRHCHKGVFAVVLYSHYCHFPAKSFSGQQHGLECNMAFIQQLNKLYFSGADSTGLGWTGDGWKINLLSLFTANYAPMERKNIVSPQFLMRAAVIKLQMWMFL